MQGAWKISRRIIERIHSGIHISQMARRRIKRVLVAVTDDTPLGIPLLDGIIAFTKQAEPWLICPTSNGEQLLEIVEYVKPDGLIVARVSNPFPLRRSPRRKYPASFVGISEALPKQHPVLIGDHPLIGRTGARHLLDTRAVSYGFVGYGDTVFSNTGAMPFWKSFETWGTPLTTSIFRPLSLAPRR